MVQSNILFFISPGFPLAASNMTADLPKVNTKDKQFIEQEAYKEMWSKGRNKKQSFYCDYNITLENLLCAAVYPPAENFTQLARVAMKLT